MIDVDVEIIKSVLRIENVDDYPQIDGVLIPAAEQAICDAIGAAWVQANTTDPTLKQTLCILLATWFDRPEAFGEITPGANFLLSQLQARALDYVAEEVSTDG